jgi:hypothetical protein
MNLPVYHIVNYNIYGVFDIQPPGLERQFWDYLATCGSLVADWEDDNYSRIEIYRLRDEGDC